jgi:hypothetical protein
MFKPLSRNAKNPPKPNGGFAETQFLHTAGEDDYSGFAPTQMFGDDEAGLEPLPAPAATPAAARAAASTSQSVLERVASTSAQSNPAAQQAQATSQWVAAQEAKAHEAADQARAVIAAQRRAEEQLAGDAATDVAAPRTGLARLRAAFERLLPGGLLPLFIGVSVTMALISTALPLIDRH